MEKENFQDSFFEINNDITSTNEENIQTNSIKNLFKKNKKKKIIITAIILGLIILTFFFYNCNY
jgi:predicted negative regulator of RcsB-dependent stress response